MKDEWEKLAKNLLLMFGIIAFIVLVVSGIGSVLTTGRPGEIGGITVGVLTTLGVGIFGRKRKKPEVSSNPTDNAAMVRESADRIEGVGQQIEDTTERVEHIAERSNTTIEDIASDIDDRAREDGSIADRVREQIKKNNLGT